ncbi:MAG: TonB family protein [Verrucomicrobiota bacterium]
MARDARFWRNVTIMAVIHIAGLIALMRWGRAAGSTPPNIVWMSAVAEAPTDNSPNEEVPSPPPEDEESSTVPVKSEIELPTVTPTPVVTPTPKPKATATATPKPTPKPTAKPKPKPTAAAKAAPSAPPKKTAIKIDTSKADNAASKAAQRASQAARVSEFAWYGRMLHDRFNREWAQPMSIVATGAKMAAVAKIRIEKDGRVSNFTIVQPSGNVVVDESVAAVAKRVTQVDPLPSGFTSANYYEVKINFELNAE